MAFNPDYLLQGVEVLAGRRGADRDGGLAETGAGAEPGARRLPLPAHARARELTGAGHRGVHVRTLWLTDFRSYTSIEVNLSPGLTVLVGANGEGKTNLLEALAWLATLASFRGAPTDALVRRGASFAVVRALAERDGRELLLEAQIAADRPQSRPGQPPAAAPGAGPARVATRHRLHARRLGHRQGWTGRAAAFPRRRAGGAASAERRLAGGGGQGAPAAQRAPAPGRGSARRGGRVHARRVGRQAGAGGRGAGGGPASTCSIA